MFSFCLLNILKISFLLQGTKAAHLHLIVYNIAQLSHIFTLRILKDKNAFFVAYTKRLQTESLKIFKMYNNNICILLFMQVPRFAVRTPQLLVARSQFPVPQNFTDRII